MTPRTANIILAALLALALCVVVAFAERPFTLEFDDIPKNASLTKVAVIMAKFIPWKG